MNSELLPSLSDSNLLSRTTESFGTKSEIKNEETKTVDNNVEEKCRKISRGRAGSMLPWDQFSNWIHCVCIVTFDLELGQAIELIYPPHVKLSEKEKTNICYLSFPDSNSGCMGDTVFHFRTCIKDTRNRSKVSNSFNKLCPPIMQVDGEMMFGFVFFRQVRDRSLKRGYFQKSFVILSKFPFFNLFYKLIDVIAPEYFENGEVTLEAVCNDINHWSPPHPGDSLTLPIMGSILYCRIPNKIDKPGSHIKVPVYNSSIPAPIVIPSIDEMELFECFSPILAHIHLLWELVITGEPIVVMSTSPTVCSQFVQALTSIIWPVRYCCDYRPFFTIHDTEMKEFTSQSHFPPSIILGVTNPFFAKTLQHWPHIIRIGDYTGAKALNTYKQKPKKAGNLKTLDSKPGLYTQYKPFLQKDKAVFGTIFQGVKNKRPGEVQSVLLRRHLLELTHSFMIPLERYMTTLMPLVKDINPFKSAPDLYPFNPDEFIRSLQVCGPLVTIGIKGKWEGLYRKFFRSKNFSGWYHQRYRDGCMKLRLLHLEALGDANFESWAEGRAEVEIVDMILRLKEEIDKNNHDNAIIGSDTVSKLRNNLKQIVTSLPEDLRNYIKL